MSNIVIFVRQNGHSNEAACRSASEVRKRECVSSRIGLIDKGKSNGTKCSNQDVLAAGRNVARIFVQRNLS